MKLLITGATGFLGKYTIASALNAGIEVSATVRSADSEESLRTWLSKSNTLNPGIDPHDLTTVKVDLRAPKQIGAALRNIDVVAHLAATKAGDFYTQFAGTVNSTENLLAQMSIGGVSKLVGVSTFSVYDYPNMADNTLLDETSPVVTDPSRRDEYTQTKLIQEDLYHNFANVHTKPDLPNQAVILRPGMIYGPDNLWHALLGSSLGPRFLKIGSKATLPLIYVENCADAIVQAASKLNIDPDPISSQVFNLVDDDLPTQKQYADLVASKSQTPASVQVPWGLAKTIAKAFDIANSSLVGGRAKLPGIVVPDRLEARFKPLNFTNLKAKTVLDWSPRFDLGQAIDRSVEVEKATAKRPASADTRK